MRSGLLSFFIAVTIFFFLPGQVSAQNGFNTGLNGTVINLPCNQNCVTQAFKIPHLKSTSDYSINLIGYTPFTYSTPTGNEITEVYADDQYSALINMPFSFCFYDSTYTRAVVGSNGLLTFDETNASPPVCGNSGQYHNQFLMQAEYNVKLMLLITLKRPSWEYLLIWIHRLH